MHQSASGNAGSTARENEVRARCCVVDTSICCKALTRSCRHPKPTDLVQAARTPDTTRPLTTSALAHLMLIDALWLLTMHGVLDVAVNARPLFAGHVADAPSVDAHEPAASMLSMLLCRFGSPDRQN